MKTLLNKFTAAISVCAIALCSFSSTVSAEDTDKNSEITITFDYMSDGATVKDESVFAPITVNAGSSIEIPEGTPSRDGYFFSGWTCDDIHAYTDGDVFRSPDGKNVTLRPIWCEKNQEVTYEVKYVVEMDGEILDTSKELKTFSYCPGQVVTISLMSYSRNDATQYGWSDGTTAFSGQEKMIIHDHDVTLTPNWHTKYKITYTVGDVDRVVGATFMEYEQPEKIPTGLQAADRFSRNGFTISGWLCDDDNKIYAPHTPSYIMPSHDVTFTAVWSPKEYTVVFKQDNKSANNLKVKGFTDTNITTPEPTITKDGYYFAGWKFGDEIYPAGSDYKILGAIAGSGIALEAVWNEGTPPETTTLADVRISNQDISGTEITGAELILTGKDSEGNDVIFHTENVTAGTGAELISIRNKSELRWISGNESTYVRNLPNGTYTLHEVAAPEGYKVTTDITFTIENGVVTGNAVVDGDTVTIITSTIYPEVAYGDANEDGEVNISDAVLIMQSIANPEEFSITETGKINGDVTGHGDGITNNDALVIQLVEIKTLTVNDLPYEFTS